MNETCFNEFQFRSGPKYTTLFDVDKLAVISGVVYLPVKDRDNAEPNVKSFVRHHNFDFPAYDIALVEVMKKNEDSSIHFLFVGLQLYHYFFR